MSPEKIGLVDDHTLLRNGLAGLVAKLGYEVLFECSNGKEMKAKIIDGHLPHVVLMDINMPEMDGYDATIWLRENYPEVLVLALSMYDDENAIIRMLRSGARGYILKEADPVELKRAIDDVVAHGVYYSDLVTGKMMHSVNQRGEQRTGVLILNEREIEFLKLVSTELTYKEIAEKMYLSARTIDGYREALFEKLQIRNRVGLVLFAIKNRIVQVF